MIVELTFTECQFMDDEGEDMSHSLYSYLQRRTTEELENILILYMRDPASEVGREVVRMTVDILSEREVHLPAEYEVWLEDYFEKS